MSTRFASRKKRHLALLAVLLWLGLCGQAAAEVHGKAGVGTGLAYGWPAVGAGLEVDLGSHFAVLGGIGVGPSTLPWSVGVRVYLQPRERKWRFHGSAFHWTEGNGIYFGADHDVGKLGGWVATYAVGFLDVNLEGNVGVSIGIGYSF